ncbi:MAG: 30S ribosomal protein S6 [Bacillota bacterium]|nr:30S ribosomal protein S6 [Bacillota bacterium]
MRAYEMMYIARPDLSIEDMEDVARRLAELVLRHGGNVHSLEPWGRRRLAYEIAGYREGLYFLMLFEGSPDLPKELQRIVGLTDKVLRGLVVRLEKGLPQKEDLPAEAPEAAEEETAAPQVEAGTEEPVSPA